MKKQIAKRTIKKNLKKKNRPRAKHQRIQKNVAAHKKIIIFENAKKIAKKKGSRIISATRKKIRSIVKKRRTKPTLARLDFASRNIAVQSVSYVIRVMPALSEESLKRVTEIGEITPITQSFEENALVQETIIQKQEDSLDIKIEDSKIIFKEHSLAAPSIDFKKDEKVFFAKDAGDPPKKNLKEKTLSSAIIENFKVLRELTIYKFFYFTLWPLIKAYSLVYLATKLYFVKRKNAKARPRKNQKVSSAIDVFAAQPKKFTSKNEYFLVFRRLSAASIGLAAIVGLSFLSHGWYKKAALVKNAIMTDSQYAIESMKKGQNSVKNLDLESATKNFESSKIYFEKAKKEFAKLDIVTRTLTQKIPRVGKDIKAGFLLLDAGKNIAEAGEQLSIAAHSLFFEPSGREENIIQSFIDKLLVLEESLDFAIPKIAQAKLRIDGINIDSISLSNKDALYMVKQTLPSIEENLVDVSSLAKTLLHAMGYGGWKRYLLLFENSNELRATGGFIGSFALVDISDGEIKNLEIPAGGSYDLQGSLTALVESPKPLHIINPIWEFQDSNWWPDFPTSAKKISWFYQKAQGPSVDGIVAITSSLMEKILEVAGPIAMEDYGRIITSENFVDETQKIVELEYDKVENKPKQFIADLAPELFKKISSLNQAGIQELLAALYQGFKEKQIVVYSSDADIQKIIVDLDWGGSQKDSQGGDYLSIIHSNIAGAKTDEVIDDSLYYGVKILDDGSIVNTVKITREHTGIQGDIFTGAQNNSYVRVYVPKGSTLISAQGFTPPNSLLFENPPFGYKQDEDFILIEGKHMVEPVSGTDIYNENEKTVFGNWIMTRPGEVQEVVLQYILPFKITSQNPIYTLTLQKQIGKKFESIIADISYPSGFNVKETYPKLESQKFLFLQNNIPFVSIRDTIDSDKFYGIVFENVSNK